VVEPPGTRAREAGETETSKSGVGGLKVEVSKVK
jgi:hypothetical protein